MYAYNDPKKTMAAYDPDENGPQACAPICGGSIKPRIHGVRALAYFGPWTGASVIGKPSAQGKVYV